jgi:pyruvate dehydrogenase kinase 2/3/4
VIFVLSRLYAKRKQTDISLLTLMHTGQGKHLHMFEKIFPGSDAKTDSQKIQIQVASFLHRELPVRLAHRALELESPIVNRSSYVRQVCNWYKRSFQELRNCPAPTTLAIEAKFHNVINGIFERHSSTLINMAKGAHQLRAIFKQASS